MRTEDLSQDRPGRFSITDSTISTEVTDSSDPNGLTSILDLITFADQRVFLSAKDVQHDACGLRQQPRPLTYDEMRRFLDIAMQHAPDSDLLRILAEEIQDQLHFRRTENPNDASEIDELLAYIAVNFL